MRRIDDESINRFRERFGDLLLTCRGERGQTASAHVDVGDPMLHASYGNENEPDDFMWKEEANTARMLKLESGSPKSQNLYAPDSFSSMIGAEKHETFHDFNLPGSGAVLHNKAGDLHSPMVRYNTTIPSFLGESIQHVSNISWNGPDCFTPLAETQRWSCDEAHFGLADDITSTFLHRDSGYVTGDGVDHDILTDDLFAQPDSNFDLATSEEHANESWPYGDDERFRYHVRLQAPTAMLWNNNENPVTYLNKGQTYCLKVLDSTPPTNKIGLFKYKTRRSEVKSGCMLATMEGRPRLKEAHERKGKILAVEYVNPFQGNVRNQGDRHIQLEQAFVDGFCVTWTPDLAANIYEAAISLKFNFLSTDFSRSKGVKGVPVRLCAKTEILRSDDENRTMEEGPEMCYCVVKLFRDHGAERKFSNDKTHAEKKIEKLQKQIVDKKIAVNFDRRNRKNSPSNVEKIDIRPQKKRRWSISSRQSSMSGRELYSELATMTEILSSARPVSVLDLRGNEKDDPDLYPICLSHGMSNSIKADISDNQHSIQAT
ncbi:hypothetical protein N7541_001787 [Penicillium brevicompactum]|uniref:Grh/CP2 DB domain-containing protein n=1 Tax=Penicillium brevicompactum TaxID=5074 RepID=A0A9W9RWU8_PENBR|nr:hypothetical protein N7541_001787 [Penicillium brevicompactum]